MANLVFDSVDGLTRGCRTARLLGVFEEARLQAYGYTLAAMYTILLVYGYRAGSWIINTEGAPAYTDFTTIWVAGTQALLGQADRLYDPIEFIKVQSALLGSREFFYPNWPYPPTFLLIAAPLGALPYLYAFLSWDGVTLLALLIIAYLIVRRRSAIALLLACPFTAWNFMAGQNGFLTGSLLGAALLCIESRPVLAGVFIGCLTYKPQFGVLLPVALIAARQWRAFGAAACTTVILGGLSAALFGIEVWRMLPAGLLAQKDVVLLGGGDPDAVWGRIQTVYGLVRDLHGGGVIASITQAAITLAIATIIWRLWRSQTRYELKAAFLSAAALVCTPYAFSYDMVALSIPAAFLVRDQLRHGVLRGEQTLLLTSFGIILATFVGFWLTKGQLDFGTMPLGLIGVTTLMLLVLRRVSQEPLEQAFPSASHV